MHKYMHHIGDFMSDTVHLTALEECFYRRALDFYYMNEKPLPKETQSVFRRLRARTQEEQDAVLNILSDFFTEQDDGYHNKRADAEIASYQGNAVKNRENGKKGGRPKKDKALDNQDNADSDNSENPEETQSVNYGLDDETQTKGNQQPTTNNQQPVLKKARSKKFDPLIVELPDQVDPDVWKGFVEMRNSIKKPMTERAAELIIKKLIEFGSLANIALDNSTRNNWQDVFQPKDETRPIGLGNTQSPSLRQPYQPRFSGQAAMEQHYQNQPPFDENTVIQGECRNV